MNLPATVPILMYHSVSTEATRAYQQFNITPEALGAHLDVIAAEGYAPVTLSHLVDALPPDGTRLLPQRPVVLTFDDGFCDFHSIVLPALVERGFTATAYVVAGLIGGRAEWLKAVGEGERPLMTPAMIREVADLGIECGAHGLMHVELDAIPRRSAASEISVSKRILEDILGHRVRSFAYPYGYHDRWVAERVRAAGFESAVAVRHALTHPFENRFGLSRLIVSGDTSPATVRDWLHGEGAPLAPRGERVATTVARLVRRARAWAGPRPGWVTSR